MIFNKRFGRYTLVKKLAMGGMAEVFLGLKRGPDRFEKLVALKRLHDHLSDDKEVVGMFYTEARLGGLFEHPNLVTVFDADVIDGHHTMVMEFVPGQTVEDLATRLAERGEKMPVGLSLSIIAEAADGLHQAHTARDLDGTALRIVHRDVSPQNVLIAYDGAVRVFDFGVAVAASKGGGGQLAGKTAYMSPEQCRGKEIDARSDVFALGIVLHELLSGQSLFKRDNHIKSLRAITEDDVPAPSTLRAGITPEVDAIVLKALARNPDERYESAHALQIALVDHLVVTNDLVVAHEALEQLMGRLFAAEVSEIGMVIEKILLAPEQSDATIDLSTFDLRAEADKISGIHTAAADGGASPLTPALTHPGVPLGSAGPVDGLASTAMAEQLRRAKRSNRMMAVVALLALIAAIAVFFVRPGDTTPETAVIEEPPEVALVQVTLESDPPGARVTVDGEVRAETTPAHILVTEGVETTVELFVEGYLPHVQTLTPSSTDPGSLRTFGEMEVDVDSENARIGGVRVVFNPADAAVHLNGELAGTGSPVVLEGLALNQEHQLRLSRDGYETLYFPVRLDSADPLEVQLDLAEALELGVINIRSRPSGASIRINDEELGETPLEALELPANQTYTIEVRRSGHRRWRRAILLRPGAEEDIVAELQPDGEREPEPSEPELVPDTPATVDGEPEESGEEPAAGTAEPEPEPDPEEEEDRYQLLLE